MTLGSSERGGGSTSRTAQLPVAERAPVLSHPRRGRRRALFWSLVAAAAAVALMLFLVSRLGSKASPLPNLTGKGLAYAQEVGQKLDLEVTTTYEFSSRRQNTIIGTEPGPGTEMEAGDPLALVVSKGPELVKVPSLAGRPFDEDTMRDALTRAGLSYEGFTFVDGAAGIVVGTDPPAGQMTSPGTAVTVLVGREKRHDRKKKHHGGGDEG